MRFFDISVPVTSGLPGFPGDPPVIIEQTGQGDFRLSRLSFGSHAGTHLDAPAHLFPGGATVEQIPLDRLIGPCQVIDCCTAKGPLDAALLQTLPLQNQQRLLFRTANSGLWQQPHFVEDYVALTPDGADYLAQCGVWLVGIDYLSVEAFHGDGSVHRRLLKAGVILLEGLDLTAVAPGFYELICLPLKLPGGDGAPCRAVLRREG